MVRGAHRRLVAGAWTVLSSCTGPFVERFYEVLADGRRFTIEDRSRRCGSQICVADTPRPSRASLVSRNACATERSRRLLSFQD
jgi:hypothetical protein